MSVAVSQQPQSPLGTSSSYTFTTTPRALGRSSNKKKATLYRDPGTTITSNAGIDDTKMYNIMTDRRIRRGTTVSSAADKRNATAQQKEEEDRMKREKDRLRRERERLKQQQILAQLQLEQSGPEPVSGRKHITIQTEEYLEEITDRVEDKDAETQTDPFKDRPPSPQFIPPKSGLDIATQIWPGELFDFDTEVEPILSLLIAKTLEQSIMEVREEEEIANMKAHQEAFEAKRASELAETQRMEEEELRKEREKQERLAAEKERVEKEKRVQEKNDARSFAQRYLQELTPAVFENLTDKGYFYDPVLREVEIVFVPWLLSEMEHQLNNVKLANALVDDLIANLIQKGVALHQDEKLQEQLREQAEKEQARLLELQQQQQQQQQLQDRDKENTNKSADESEEDDNSADSADESQEDED